MVNDVFLKKFNNKIQINKGVQKGLPYFFASAVFCARLPQCHSHYSKKTSSHRLLQKFQLKRKELAGSMMWRKSTRPFEGRASARTVDGSVSPLCWNSIILKRVRENRHGHAEVAPSSHTPIEPSRRWKGRWQRAAFCARLATSAVTTMKNWIYLIQPTKI